MIFIACFAAPAALGVLTTVFRNKFPKNWHVNWLNTMIFGGSLALGVEHFMHGEIVPWPPFLTAMSNPTSAAQTFGEILSVGIPMTIALICVWIGMVVVYERINMSKTLIRTSKNFTGYKLDFLALILLGAFILSFIDLIAS